MASERITVGIVDDEAFVRHALAAYLAADETIEVVAAAEDGAGALALVAEHGPEVLLLDLQLPDIDGVEVARRLADGASATRVLVITAHVDDRFVTPALLAGASGYLVKDAEPARILAAVHEAAEGNLPLDPQVTRYLIDAVGRTAAPGRAAPPPAEDLTERETQVLSALCEGRDTAEMARELMLSESTIKYYLSHLLAKFGVRDRVQLVVAAFRSGAVR